MRGLGVRCAALAVALTAVMFFAPKEEAGAAATVTCAGLTGTDFSAVAGTVSSAEPATVQGHRYCAVAGKIAGRAGFQLELPLAGWQGQYLQEGCGGFCGTSALDALPSAGYSCAPALNGTLAVGKDDTGHTSASVNDGSFGADPLSRAEFGRTSEHSLARLAKAVLRAFYGTGPRYSYFDGCSTGGRQGLNEAQNYPADFDGILAGAPASNNGALSFEQAWLVRSNTDKHGHQILPAEKLPALHAAVVKECGEITEPRACGFDPETMLCRGADGDTCLTAAQVDTVRKFYRGPVTPSGLGLFNGGLNYGSELGWRSWAVMPRADKAAPGDTQAAQLALNAFRYLAYPHNPATFSLADVRFTLQNYLRVQSYAQRMYNANNPDLRAFSARGGKIMLYHGLADEAIPPQSTVDYYAWLERYSGGFANSQRFSRLYLLPGAYHCLFGPDLLAPTRANLAELLTPLLTWVQDGKAPGTITALDVPLDGQGSVITQHLPPVDALRPAPAAPGSLNAGYHYVGAISDYLPGPG